MIEKIPNGLFFIVVSLIVILISLLRHPALSRQQLFNKFEDQLKNGQFNPEEYWQFRERFSPGNFVRNEENVDFFANFRLISVEDSLTPMFYYQSKYLNSIDALVSKAPNEVLNNFKEEYPGEIVAENDSYLLIKESEKKYIFAFVISTDEMQKVNGLFDYKTKEKELLENKYWYNTTYLELR